MVTISLCMIVRNEEKNLAKCLDSLKDLFEEIVIIDTGSTDKTKQIAFQYTNQIYDFEWAEDFSLARNFAFSKCSMDYIYTADADELLDSTNHLKFLQLKEVLLPEIEIVQMKYIENNLQSVLNCVSEYRPKLFKRQRNFIWIDPIHETIRLDPVVFDSDIEICHQPDRLHASRDFSTFEKAYARDGLLSKNLYTMYAKELLKCGSPQDFLRAAEIFANVIRQETLDALHLQAACCILVHAARIEANDAAFIKYASKVLSSEACSEICYELGEYFTEKKDYEEAALWFYNAAFESEAILDIHRSGDLALRGLHLSYQAQADSLRQELSALQTSTQTLSETIADKNTALSASCESEQNFHSLFTYMEQLEELATYYRQKEIEWHLPYCL